MKIAFISDTHCGHRTGLTPPKYQYRFEDGFLGKIASLQSEMWNWFRDEINQQSAFDLIVCVGDLIDGSGKKSGGTELITTDPAEQIKMAEEVIKICNAKKVLIINGTAYHTGVDTDYEGILAEKIGAHYANHEFIKCGGLIFDVKHKTSSSIIPHGRFTGPARDTLWNGIQAQKGMQPKADFIIRGHVHYYSYSKTNGVTTITLPCLQAMSKFGSRECAGTNDLGFLTFECENGSAKMTEYLFDMQAFSSEVIDYGN